MPLIQKRALFMAPMVDLSHEPYRELVRSFGGCDLFYSEMLNSRIVPYENPAVSQYLSFNRTDDLILQIVGNDIEKLRLSAERLEGFSPWGIDINMGCYLKKITCHGWGVAMMKDINAAEKAITAVRKVTSKPLSVKFRVGQKLDLPYLLTFGRMIESAGADFLVLHARSESDALTRPARWEYITKLKNELSIPVIGNGDVTSAVDAVRMFNETGCDGVMIGRGALIRPWIFREIRDLLSGRKISAAPAIKEVMLELLCSIKKWFPEETAVKRFKLALPWLAKNLRFGHHFVKNIRGPGLNDMRRQIHEAFDADMS
jgi:tRNA-dihydrouridine synthase B